MAKKVLPSIHISLQEASGAVAWVWYMYFSWLADNMEKNTADIAELDTELDTKVDKTDQAERLYGTDENGDQTTYDIDSLISDVNLDNVTIDKNSSDQLQAIGTKNKNGATGATSTIYDWVGTLAEYNAQNIATTHPDWLCFITDDVNPDTTYTKAEADALFVRKTGNYNEEANGEKNFTDTLFVKYRKTAPSTNTVKESSVADNYIVANVNTSGKADGMYIVRRQETNGDRFVVYGSVFRNGADDASLWTELQIGVTQNDTKVARVSTSDMSVSTSSYDIVTTRHLIRVLQAIWPVGSIFITETNSCPLASLFGTWTLQTNATDRALWGGNGSNGGGTIAAGAPNITGNVNGVSNRSFYASPTADGVFYVDNYANNQFTGGGGIGSNSALLHFNAARSSSVYGNSSTIQPPAYRVNVWKRTA